MRAFGIRRNRTPVIAVFSCLLCSLSVIASQQDYIEAIKADVHEFSSGSFDPPVDSLWVGADSLTIERAEKKHEGLDAFSDFLKAKSPGTHIFYQKLPVQFQQKVHEEYLATGDLERAKKSVFKYLGDLRK